MLNVGLAVNQKLYRNHITSFTYSVSKQSADECRMMPASSRSPLTSTASCLCLQHACNRSFFSQYKHYCGPGCCTPPFPLKHTHGSHSRPHTLTAHTFLHTHSSHIHPHTQDQLIALSHSRAARAPGAFFPRCLIHVEKILVHGMERIDILRRSRRFNATVTANAPYFSLYGSSNAFIL